MFSKGWCALLLCSFLFIFTTGCEKEVDLKLNSGASKIVVEGGIENGSPPLIVLTKSISYFSKIDLASLEDAFIHNASIQVSDGSGTISLREYSIDTGGQGNKFYFYSIDTANPASFGFLGVSGKDYHLRIDVDGKQYTASTRIPAFRTLDSFWYGAPDVLPKDVPGARLLYIRYTDPDTLGNSTRFFTKRNSEPYYPGVNSVFNDEVINGTAISVSIPSGYDKSKAPKLDSLGYVFVGDTVTLRWSAIDRATYDFWSTLEFSTGSVGSPFSTPIQVAGNISGGALGVWAGYGSQYRTIVIKP